MDKPLPTTIALAAARPPRQPTRTRVTGLILLAFMLVVFFIGPGQLPVFFQRLVALVNALLAMLVVVFAIREYGKKYNRLRWPLFGRVSTSKVAGTLAFVAVFGWWLSPWAPITAGEAEPDLWRLLERGLDEAVLTLADTEFATLAAPAPSAAARRAAGAIGAESPQFSQTLKAIGEARFDHAQALLEKLEKAKTTDRNTLELIAAARAQADLYAGRFGEASGQYGKLLKDEPRREDYLAHGALAAALQGDYSTAGDRASQLRDQAAARRHDSIRYRQAVNLLVAIRVMQGKYAEAGRMGEETKPSRERTARETERRSTLDPQLAVDANNQAVVIVLTAPQNAESLSAGFVSAKKLWIDWNVANGQPRDLPDLNVAAAEHNLGMVALAAERFDQAELLLADSLAVQRQAAAEAKNPGIGVNLSALAELARKKAGFPAAESLLDEAEAALSAGETAALVNRTTRAALDADRGQYELAIARYKTAVQSMEALSSQHPYAAVLKIRLAEVYLLSGNSKDAESSVRGGLDLLDRAGLDRQPTRAVGLRILASAHLRQEDRDAARREFDAAAKLLGISPLDDDERRNDPIPATLEVAALRAARAELADSAETYPAALADCEVALAIVRKVFGEPGASHPLFAQYMHDMARVDVRRDKLLVAEPLLRQALAIDENALPADHPAIISLLDDLANVVDKMGQADEARSISARAKRLRAQRS